MKKGLLILLFLSIYGPFFAQHVVEKSIESSSSKVEIYLDKIDNLILLSAPMNKVSVRLNDTDERFSTLKILKEKGRVVIRGQNLSPNQDSMNKFCVEQPVFASYKITVPLNSSVYVNIISGNFKAQNFRGNIRAEIETGEVQFIAVKGNVKLFIVDGNIKINLKKGDLDLKTNLGTLESHLSGKNLKKSAKSLKGFYIDKSQLVTIKAIKANIYVEALKD
jgi:hypothetical protein